LPPAASFQWKNDTVYFAETILSQFQPNGTGFGTFEMDSNATTTSNVKFGGSEPGNSLSVRDISQVIDGAILRYVPMLIWYYLLADIDGSFKIS
jgi:hypothetical protein